MKYILVALLIINFSSIFAQENQRYVNINGTSELIRNADQINFTIKIKIIDESLEASKIINDKNLADLFTILNKVGINSSEIDVSPLMLGKYYEYDRERQQKQKGYYTEVQVSFLLTDLSKYYELTNQLATSNSFEITNSSYTISDYEIQHKIAYENALKAAKEKAQYMANTLGLKLGDVLEIDENNYWQSYANPFNTVTVENSPNTSSSGKVTIRRSVRVKFALN